MWSMQVMLRPVLVPRTEVMRQQSARCDSCTSHRHRYHLASVCRRLLQHCWGQWRLAAKDCLCTRLHTVLSEVQMHERQHTAEVDQLRRDNARYKRIIDEDSSLMRSAELMRTGACGLQPALCRASHEMCTWCSTDTQRIADITVI